MAPGWPATSPSRGAGGRGESPRPRQRRAKGKSDSLDAYAAADAVLSGRACATPKLGTGIVEAIRALHSTRAGAVKARTAATNELRSLLITAPAEVRDRLRGLAPVALVERACGCAPPATPPTPRSRSAPLYVPWRAATRRSPTRSPTSTPSCTPSSSGPARR